MSTVQSPVHVQHDPPMYDHQLHHIRGRLANGVNAVEIKLRFRSGTSTEEILSLLSQAAEEVRRTAVRAQHPSRESEGSRWHG